MVDTVIATLSQNGDSVELPLLAPGGDLVMAVDYGKPELVIHNVGGSTFPRIQDQWSGLGQFSIFGRFRGTDAYSDAIALAELVHSDGGGEPMILDVPGVPELERDMSVAPSAEQARALNLAYEPGRKDVVDIDLGLTRVDSVLGSYDREVSTPTDTGTGPIELSNGDITVPLEYDLQVDRYVGRPNDVIRRNQGRFPRYLIKNKVLHDEFELSLMLTDNAVSFTQDLVTVFSQRAGREGFTLDFNGIYGLGSFNVIPDGSQGMRHVRETGKQDISVVPNISLRRIQA